MSKTTKSTKKRVYLKNFAKWLKDEQSNHCIRWINNWKIWFDWPEVQKHYKVTTKEADFEHNLRTNHQWRPTCGCKEDYCDCFCTEDGYWMHIFLRDGLVEKFEQIPHKKHIPNEKKKKKSVKNEYSHLFLITEKHMDMPRSKFRPNLLPNRHETEDNSMVTGEPMSMDEEKQQTRNISASGGDGRRGMGYQMTDASVSRSTGLRKRSRHTDNTTPPIVDLTTDIVSSNSESSGSGNSQTAAKSRRTFGNSNPRNTLLAIPSPQSMITDSSSSTSSQTTPFDLSSSPPNYPTFFPQSGGMSANGTQTYPMMNDPQQNSETSRKEIPGIFPLNSHDEADSTMNVGTSTPLGYASSYSPLPERKEPEPQLLPMTSQNQNQWDRAQPIVPSLPPLTMDEMPHETQIAQQPPNMPHVAAVNGSYLLPPLVPQQNTLPPNSSPIVPLICNATPIPASIPQQQQPPIMYNVPFGQQNMQGADINTRMLAHLKQNFLRFLASQNMGLQQIEIAISTSNRQYVRKFNENITFENLVQSVCQDLNSNQIQIYFTDQSVNILSQKDLVNAIQFTKNQNKRTLELIVF